MIAGQTHLHPLYPSYFKKSDRTSKGRRRLQHQRIFEETLAQYESGDVYHLDDLTYDPII